MKPRTIALQIFCCVTGALFISAEFVATKAVSEGGLFFFFASILGADQATNASETSRRFFKSLVVISALPFIALCTYLLINASDASPLALLGQAAKIVLFSACMAAIVMDNHPLVQRVLKKCGFSVPKNEGSR